MPACFLCRLGIVVFVVVVAVVVIVIVVVVVVAIVSVSRSDKVWRRATQLNPVRRCRHRLHVVLR